MLAYTFFERASKIERKQDLSFYRVSFGVIKRTEGGSALRRSAYQRCAKGSTFDFSLKVSELAAFEVMLPLGAAAEMADPVKLWAAAEGAEKRKDAQLGRTFDIAIPNEVPDDLRNEFARELLQPMVDRGFAVEWSRHKADGVFGDVENDHIHALVSLRQLGPGGFSATKDRDFNAMMTRNQGKVMRAEFADCMNTFFRENNIDASVNHLRTDEATLPHASTFVRKQMKMWKVSGADESAHPPQLREFLEARAQVIEFRSEMAELQQLEADVARLKAEEPVVSIRPGRQLEIIKINDINMRGFIDDGINKDGTLPAIGQLRSLRSRQENRGSTRAGRALDSNADRRDRSNTTHTGRDSCEAKSVNRAVSKIAELVVRFLFGAALVPPVVDLAELLKTHFSRSGKARNDPKINEKTICNVDEGFRINGGMVYLKIIRELARAERGQMLDMQKNRSS